LLYFFRSHKIIIPPDSVDPTLIAFWAGDSNPKEENKTYQGMRIHILNVVLIVKYRNLELPTSVDAVLNALQTEQSELEKKIDSLTIYVAGYDFTQLSQTDQDILTDQLAAMNTYNNRLKTRILNY
jgi:hypothetical protein